VRLSDQALDAARRRGDAVADPLIASLGSDVWAINALVGPMTDNDSPCPSAVPRELRALLIPALPAWADVHRLRRAQEFARRNLFGITVGLFCASLPLSYTARSGARILRLAGRMSGDIDRRIHETARFVLDVLAPNGFDAGGAGRIAIGKVRLVHAAVRVALLARGGEAETPINQEDQAGTLGLFSVVVLKALVRLGVSVDPSEQEDFVYLWRVVGAMMGIEEALLPENFTHGDALLSRIRRRQAASSEDGRLLMGVLLEGMQRHLALGRLRTAPPSLVRYLIGHEAADVLGVPGVASASAQRRVVHATSRLVPMLGARLIHLLTTAKLEGLPVTFAMPTLDRERSRRA